ncbi:MAG: outer membrane protein assembly factor BamA [Myxococcota bacterium]
MQAERRFGPGRRHLALSLICLFAGGLPDGAGGQPSTAGDRAGGHVIAVLPFRVHSAKPLDALGESLSERIRARLEADGQIRVLDAAAVRRRFAEPATADRGDPALRRIAEDLGAHYVVTGSLTELAGSFSLDVRLTPTSIALRPHTLVLTARREDELLSRLDEIADRLIQRVVGAARVAVVRVEIIGADARRDELRGRLKTREGRPYDPENLGDDLAMLRADPGLANVDVETQRGPDGVVVSFQLVTSQRLFGESTSEPTGFQVTDVVVRGNRRIDAEAIRVRIVTRAGQPFSRGQIAKDVKAVHSLGFFKNVRVLTEPSPKGRVVIFEVEENPVVRQIIISGNEEISAEDITDILTLTTGSTLDQPLLFENRGRIEALYRAQGFYLAEVDFEIEPYGEASVAVDFRVTENEKLRLRKIEFRGNQRFSDRELREGFQTRTWKPWSYATAWFDKSGTYSEPLFIQDLRSIERKYTDAGYVRVEIGQPDVLPTSAGLEVVVQIKEGREYRVGKVEVSGENTVELEDLEDDFLLKEGEVFNRSHLSDDVALLTQRYTDRGFYFANVTPLTKLSEEEGVVDVRFDVRKGPLYFIRRIHMSGNTRTVDSVLRREIPLVEGQLYSQRAHRIAQYRLRSLGFFEEIDIEPEPTDAPDQLDLKVSVVERPTGSFSFGAGFSSADSFVAQGSLSESNLFGRGYRANVSVQYGGETQRFFLSVTDPRFLGSEFSLGLTGFLTEVDFNNSNFRQRQLGAELTAGHALSEDGRSRGFFRYSFALRDIFQDTGVNAAAVIFRELIQTNLTSSMLGLSFATDTRDDRLAPTSGYRLGGSLEGAGLGGFSKFFRVEGRASWFLGAPGWLFERSTFVVSTSLGYVLPFNTIDDYGLESLDPSIVTDGSLAGLDEIDTDLELPLSERYFLGGLGAFQLRGYKGRTVGPRRSIVTQGASGAFRPLGTIEVVDPVTGVFSTECVDSSGTVIPRDQCNSIDDKKDKDFANLDLTDVVGGNKFITSSVEYRFPISPTLGLMGVVFFDIGNTFAEGDNLFDVTEWRYGTGAGVQWFSPFGPLAVVLGWPINRLSIEDSPVFEFSVGGVGF